MFPFRFDWNEEGFDNEFAFYKKHTIDERLKRSNKGKNKQGCFDFKNWKSSKFNLKKALEKHEDPIYNEYAYFYDYARDAIYNLDEKDTISCDYTREGLSDDAKLIIYLKEQEKSYELNIKQVSLKAFATGVAILSIQLENNKYPDFKDILKINDFGRRIYPQYIKNINTEETKKSFLADKIIIEGLEDKKIIENFEFQPNSDIVIGSHILTLLGTSFTQNKDETQKYYIQPILDDRMFVISWYGNNQLSATISKCRNYYESDDWYKYVFVDNDWTTVQNSSMKEQLLTDATYIRWTEYGTIYGITRYSFAVLTHSLKKNNADFIPVHTKTMYFQMVLLALATRASIIRFSDEIAAIANKKDIDKLEKLYELYLTFYNRLYFKEVTHQDQGIELYEMIRKQMRIDEHIEKLDNKFTKLFEFADLQATKKHDDLLQLISGVFIFPSLMIALLSMGIFDYQKSWISLIAGLIAVLLSGIIGYKAFDRVIKRVKDA